MIFLKEKGKGIAICLFLSSVSWLLVYFFNPLKVIGAPVISILLGMLLAFRIKNKEKFQKGLNYVSKSILQLAVILLGFGLNLATVGKVGWTSLPIILSTITISLCVAYFMHKLLKIPIKVSTLIGVGSSICGGSAIAATAPVIQADEKEIAQSISVIFLFNMIAAIIFPTLGVKLGLSNTGFALFAGTAINDTSSVTAAASTWDVMHQTGGSVLAYATIVKLTRTLAIIPITLILSIIRLKQEKELNKSKRELSFKSIFPMFILYFIGASVFTTIVTSYCPTSIINYATITFSSLKELSKFFIIMAMSAIGLNTDAKSLVKNGGKSILMGFCCWVAIACVSLTLQALLHLQ